MAREGDPRVVVRFSPAERGLLEEVSLEHGVAVAGLVREAALRACRDVGREVSAGRVRLRRRSVALVPVPAVADRDSSGGEERASVSSSAAPGSVVVGAGDSPPARLAPAPVDPGVVRAAAFRRATQGARPAG